MDDRSNAYATTNTPDFNNMSADEFASFDLDAYLSEHEDNDDNYNIELDSPDEQVQEDVVNEPVQEENIDPIENNEGQVEDDNSKLDEVDTESTFSKLLQNPIKANGHEVIVDTPEKAVQLMQMGINYNKKMQEAKPYMGIINALKDAGIADDKTVMNQLIDIAKGDKQALLDFAKKRELDLSDDEEVEDAYVPNDNISSEEEIEFEDTFSRLKSSNNYDKFQKNIVNDFSDESSQVFYKSPQLLEALNADMENGIYNKVMATVQSKKLFEKDNRPTIDIYIESYSDVVTSIKSKQQKKANVDVAKVSKTPSRQQPTQTKEKVNLAEIDLFGMTEKEADEFYEKYLKDLPT